MPGGSDHPLLPPGTGRSRALYDVLVDLPWVVDVLRRGGQFGAGALWFVEQFLRAAEDLGATRDQALAAYRHVWCYTLGALITRVEPERRLDPDSPLAVKLVGAARTQNLPRETSVVGGPLGTPDRLYRAGLKALPAGIVTEFVAP